MINAKEKEFLESIKKYMKQHGLTPYNIGIIDSYIGKIRITPKGWLRLLVPIKGYYYDGRGVEEDEEKAEEWFLKAAEQGHCEAQFELGWLYYLADGNEEAVKWYRKAANKAIPMLLKN